MFHDLESLIEATVIATDGALGTVRNFLFDDQSWTIRYLVVDVGSWLKRRAVLVAITAVQQPDWNEKRFHVHLTKQQVRDSPDVDTEKPVSRQQEIAMKEHFGWLAYWEHGQFDLLATMPAGREFPVRAKQDPTLRSVCAVQGYEVWATDSEVGCLESFILDDASWHLGYLSVKTGDWLYSRSVLIPTRWVSSVSWAHRRIDVHRSREQI
jgi:uncharacterized protein YrrD